MVRAQDRMPLDAAPSVPSPLVGEGQGGGCHTACWFNFREDNFHSFPLKQRFHRTPLLRLPPSLILPHRKRGLPDLRNIRHNPGKPGLWGGGSGACSRLDQRSQDVRANRCSA